MRMQSNVDSPATVSLAWTHVAGFVSVVDANLGTWLMDTYRIGLTEYRALAHLVQAADRELRVNELAQRVGLNQSSATRLVSRLEAKGLARRDVCADDGRGVYAVITEEGEALVREARGPFEDRIGDVLREPDTHLPGWDARQLSHAFQEVAAVLSS